MKERLVLALSVLMLFATGFPQQSKEAREEKSGKYLFIKNTIKPVSQSVKPGFESIKGKEAFSYLAFLASDLLEGRETGTRGFDSAAEYVASRFSRWGILPAGDFSKIFPPGNRAKRGKNPINPTKDYFQRMEIKEVLDCRMEISLEKAENSGIRTLKFHPFRDFRYSTGDSFEITAAVVFAGYGISEKDIPYDDYQEVEVKNKVVMVFPDLPAKLLQSDFSRERLKGKYFPRKHMGHWYTPKANLAREKGAAAVLVIKDFPFDSGTDSTKKLSQAKEKGRDPAIKRNLILTRKSMPVPWETIPTIFISSAMAGIILKNSGKKLTTLKSQIDSTGKPRSFKVNRARLTIQNRSRTRMFSSQNVLGFCKGSDPRCREEIVIIGAHLDHLGRRGKDIYHGADDNASGVSAVMEIAQAFALNPRKPRSPVLFALWTGEEVGLLGSRYYVAYPAFPLEKTIAYLNLDTIGREFDRKSFLHASSAWTLRHSEEVTKKNDFSSSTIITLSPGEENVVELLKKNNAHAGLHLYFRLKKNSGFNGDFGAFARKHIPWASFFASSRQDYHQPGDTMEKISPFLIEKIARLAYLTAFSLADR
jgi:hypothetical protein